MATQKKLAMPLLAMAAAAALMAAATATSREVPHTAAHQQLPRLSRRLAAGGGVMGCWTALTELRSCSNEIVLFFLNGESYLGQPCCRAIRVITRQCWPSMLAAVGFTAEEGDILRGYCDASAPPAPVAPAPLAPAPAAAVINA